MPIRALPHPKTQALPDTLTPGSLRRHAAGWLLDSKVRQLSPATLESRQLVTDKLLWFLEQQGMETCGTLEIKQFLYYIGTAHENTEGRWGNPANSRKARPATVALYYARLRTFFAYLVAEGVLTETPFAFIKPPLCREDQIQPFTPTQVTALLHAASQSAAPKRNKAILLFLLDTGLRASEFCALKMRDVDLVGQKAMVVGKGNKKRAVFFGRNATRALLAYLKEDDHTADEPLFFAWNETSSRHALTRSGLTQLIRRLGKVAHIEATRCSAHTFRHTCAIEFLRAGGNQLSLMQLLGHTQMKQTARYVLYAQSDIEAQHRQFSPADRVKTR